jgi:hypothetical protein
MKPAIIVTLAILLTSLSANTVYALTDTEQEDSTVDFTNGDKGCDDNHQNCEHVAGQDGLPFCDKDDSGSCYDRFDNHDEFCSKHPNDDSCGGGK